MSDQNNGEASSGGNKPELQPQNSLSSNMPESEMVSALPESTSTLNTTAQTVTSAAQQVLSEEKIAALKPAEELATAKADTKNAESTVPSASSTKVETSAKQTTNSTSSKSKTANIKQYRPSNSKIISQIATPGVGNKPVKVQYCNQRVIGNGSFGVVYRAELCGDSLTYPDSDFEEEENKITDETNKLEKNGEASESTKKKPVRWVAIKKVLQDKRFKNRELTIMRTLKHTNICKLKYFFYSMGEQKDEVYSAVIMKSEFGSKNTKILKLSPSTNFPY